MQSVFANKSATITVDLIVGGNFVQPDADSVVKYTLLGNDFSPMDDYTDKEVNDLYSEIEEDIKQTLK